MILLQNAVLALLVFAVLYAISRAWEWCAGKAGDAQPASNPNLAHAARVKPAAFGARFNKF